MSYRDIGSLQSPALDIGSLQSQAIATLTVTHTTDSLLKATTANTHTTDSLLQSRNVKTHTTNSFLARFYIDFHTTNSVLAGTFTKAHTTDSLLRGLPGPIHHTTDSLLSGTSIIVGHSTDSYLSPVTGLGDITIFFNGVDRTDWFIWPFKRSVSVGGTPGQLSVTITDAGKAAGVAWRPQQFDRVSVWIGAYLWFQGQYWTGTEKRYPGTGYYLITGTCLTYESRMDKIMMRQQIPDTVVFPVGDFLYTAITLVMANYLFVWIASNIGPFASQPVFIGGQTFDTVSLLSACKTICDQFNIEMYLDQNLLLWFFNSDATGAYSLPFGTGAAPFDILDLTPNSPGEPLWQNLEVTSGGTQYVNRAFARNNQQVKGNTGDANPFVLAYIPSSSDAAEVARVGPVDAMQPTKNQTISGLSDMADSGLLAFEIHDASLETYQIGFEPGQRLSINTGLPQLTDTLIIQSVESDLVGPFPTGLVPFLTGTGPIRFAHKIKASNAKMHRRTSGQVVFSGLVAGINAPVDRTSYTPSWTIAEDLGGGIANPGVVVGPHGPPIPAVRDGIVRQVSLSFTDPPVTTDCIFDVLLDGVSIFLAGGPYITFPVGGATTIVTFSFASDPEPVKGPTSATANDAQQFTLVVIQGDADARNGLLAVTVQG